MPDRKTWRLGGEGNGSGLGERHGQLAEDGQVGVEPHPV